MFPNYPGGHGAYQDFVVRRLREHYADPTQLPGRVLDIAERFWQKYLTEVNTIMREVYSPFGPQPRPACCMLRSYLLSIALHFSVTKWVDQMRTVPAYAILSGFEFGDTPGVGTFADFFTRLWQYNEKNFSPHEHPPKIKVTKPGHDSHGFLHCFFTMKAFLPEHKISKLLLDSAHDAMPIFEYCRRQRIVPFIDLNEKRGVKLKYKNDFSIGPDGVPVCMAGLKMRHDGVELSKRRSKFRYPLMDRKTKKCSCSNPCSDAKWGRTVHLAMKDNPRLINIPPRDSEQWKLEYNARTSSERCNKRMKIDFALESGHHRSSKMWYCRLYATIMLQHLFAWELPFVPTLRAALLSAV